MEIKIMQLTDNFSLDEFIRSETATRLNIDNTPDEKIISNLKNLCINLLEPLRAKLNKPIIILSGYRCSELNKHVGGVSNSKHLYGQASDIRVEEMSNKDLVKIIQKSFKFDQLILEYMKPNDPFSGWVHVSWIGSNNRNQFITIS